MKMFPRWIAVLLCVCAGALIPEAIAQDVNAIELLRTKPTADGGQAYSLTLQALGLMTFLTLLPAIVLSMTAFTRIVIVLGLLRQALGTPQTPPNQVIVAAVPSPCGYRKLRGLRTSRTASISEAWFSSSASNRSSRPANAASTPRFAI